jgi:hypothetical protein
MFVSQWDLIVGWMRCEPSINNQYNIKMYIIVKIRSLKNMLFL